MSSRLLTKMFGTAALKDLSRIVTLPSVINPRLSNIERRS